ncbi:MAG: MgtC/SapB family protein [Candidatus Gastranaerophilales bacterium]|nr:MgtC/SapB family protein [Candidatus Gastranaerophilales bacterium]
MHHFENICTPYNIDIFMRVVSAICLGFIIGFEREITNKYAGLRTHILVCLGACVFTIISIYGFPALVNCEIQNPTGIRDTARVAAQVVTGIGFIGAGTVLRNGPTVFGLTTAATLFMAASIGMACGAGMFGLAITASIISVAVLTLIRIFERRVLNRSMKNIKRLTINLHCDNEKVDTIRDYMVSNFKTVNALKMHKLIENPEKTKLSMVVELVSKRPIQHIYDKLGTMDGIESISIDTVNEK